MQTNANRATRVVRAEPVEVCEECGRLCYELIEWRGRGLCWYPCLLNIIETENEIYRQQQADADNWRDRHSRQEF